MIEVTEEMREVIKSNIYLNITESTNRANITISGDFQGICQSIIELHEQSKWVKFDEYDKSTYPPFGVRVLVRLKGDFGLRIDFMTYILEWHNAIRPGYVTHWQPLPEFKV